MQPISIIYSFFALFFISIEVIRAENKLLIGVLTFWLFGQPIFGNPNHMIRIEAANFDLQTNRIVLIPLILIVFSTWISKSSKTNKFDEGEEEKKQPILYEKWMILYIIITIISILINYNQIGLQALVYTSQNLIVFLLFYFSVKWCISKKDYELLLRSILLFAVISAIVGLIQFFINPEFFRIGVSRTAFEQYIRANGLFTAEYDQGFFQIAALLIFFQINKGGLLGFAFILLSGAATFATMHRLSWAAWVIAIVIIGYSKFMTSKRNPAIILFGLLILILIGSIGFNLIQSSTFFHSLMARVTDNTLTVRLDLNKFALDTIRNNPLGLGSYSTSTYGRLAYAAGMPFNYEQGITFPVALIVHDGFLSAGVLHGVIGLITFSLFTLTTIYFYLIGFRKDRKNYLLSFGLSIIFILFNLTQDFSNFGSEILIFFGILLGCFAHFSQRPQNNGIDDPESYNG